MWDFPPAVRFVSRLATFARVILFDRRGTGASDPVALDGALTWEHWADDVRVVLDAVGCEQTAIAANFEDCAVALLFAATHPSRTSALVLWQASARYMSGDDYPAGLAPASTDELVAGIERGWGTEQFIAMAYPSLAGNAMGLRQLARMGRASLTPRAAARQFRYSLELDVRRVLTAVRVPTLVLHRAAPRFPPLEHARYVADHLPNGRFLTVPGQDQR
jgi:pimeloyl-ACP methyl ester carboxylesterase